MTRPLVRIFVFCLGLAAQPALTAAAPVVMAAASTKQVMDAAIEGSGIRAVASYGASGTLARQIEHGAPADLFLSANPKWMAYLVEKDLVDEQEVRVLMSNSLVLITPADAPAVRPTALAERLQGEHFVMADPKTAPVGAYGKAALESLGLWPRIAGRFVPMRNTLATVAAVAGGDAAVGLVYSSDAAARTGTRIGWRIPAGSHPPIRYLIAPLNQGNDRQSAKALISFLTGPLGHASMIKRGFLPIAAGELDP